MRLHLHQRNGRAVLRDSDGPASRVEIALVSGTTPHPAQVTGREVAGVSQELGVYSLDRWRMDNEEDILVLSLTSRRLAAQETLERTDTAQQAALERLRRLLSSGEYSATSDVDGWIDVIHDLVDTETQRSIEILRASTASVFRQALSGHPAESTSTDAHHLLAAVDACIDHTRNMPSLSSTLESARRQCLQADEITERRIQIRTLEEAEGRRRTEEMSLQRDRWKEAWVRRLVPPALITQIWSAVPPPAAALDSWNSELLLILGLSSLSAALPMAASLLIPGEESVRSRQLETFDRFALLCGTLFIVAAALLER